MKSPEPETLRLTEYFSFVPPSGWNLTVSFDNLPLRLLAYGRVLFQPPSLNDIFFKWQIANWLEGTPEWEVFQSMLAGVEPLSPESLEKLYASLLRIKVAHIAEYSVYRHPGLGPVLIIDYHYTDWDFMGRVMYFPSPTGPNDIVILSYEATVASFNTYLFEALDCMNSCVQNSPSSVLQRMHQSIAESSDENMGEFSLFQAS